MSRHLMKLIRELTIQPCGYMIVLTLDHIRIKVSYIILRTSYLCWSTNYLHFLTNANISLSVQFCLSVQPAYTQCFAYRRCITCSTHNMHLNTIHMCDMIVKCMSMQVIKSHKLTDMSVQLKQVYCWIALDWGELMGSTCPLDARPLSPNHIILINLQYIMFNMFQYAIVNWVTDIMLVSSRL